MATSVKDKKLLLKKEFLGYFRTLPLQKLAAAYIGRDEDTIIRWKTADTDFADQINRAKAEWAKENVELVKDKAWLLERIMRDDFSEKKIIAGDGDSPLVIKFIEEVSNPLPQVTVAPKESSAVAQSANPPTPNNELMGIGPNMRPPQIINSPESTKENGDSMEINIVEDNLPH